MRTNPGWSAHAENAAWFFLLGTLAAVSFSNSFFEIFSSIFMVLTIFLVIFRGDLGMLRGRWFLLVGLFLAVNLVSCLGSVDLWNSAKGIFRIFRCAILAFSTFYVLGSSDRVQKVYDFFVWVVLLTGLDALLQGFIGFDLIRGRTLTPYTLNVGRVTGPFHHANDFAAFLSLGIFLCAAFLPYALKNLSVRAKVFYAASSAVGFICLLWTFSRGAWIAVVLSFVTLAAWRKSWRTLVSVGLVVIALLWVSPAVLKNRAESLTRRDDGTVTERRVLWGEAVEMIRARPWLGFGPNTYSGVEPRYKPADSRTDFQYAHNGYLQIAAETGLLGLGSFLLVLLFFFIRVLPVFIAARSSPMGARGLAVATGVLSFLIHSATDTNLQSLRLVGLLWIALGLGLAAHRSLRGTNS
jgi:O-antigen ligase